MAAAPFRRVAIVGVGLIGGSIGLRLRRLLPAAGVIGVDRAPVLRRAIARGAIRRGTTSLSRGLPGADLVILALPVDVILRILPRVARLAGPRAIVTDVGGTKQVILRAAACAGLAGRFVGGHPMAGSERSGVAFADGALLAGAPWILCTGRDGVRALERVRRMVSRLGARPVRLDPRRHDEVVARLSHLPQLLSVALVNAAARGAARRSLPLAGPAFRQMSRLAESPPRLWDGILKTNRRAVARAVDDFGRELGRLRAALGGGAAAHFRRAARTRARLGRRFWRSRMTV